MAGADTNDLHKVLDAVVDMGSGVDLQSLLQRITDLAAELVDARYAALGVLDTAGTELCEFITSGIDDSTRAEIGAPPKGRGILGVLITDARPIRLVDLHDHVDSFGFPPGHPPMRSFLGVPIRIRDQVYGNLYLTEKAGGRPFNEVDEERIVGLAAAVGVAIENARLQERIAGLLVFEERERIARDLHDRVIQRLFATGLSLQSTLSLIPEESEAVRRVESAMEVLDETIRQIRASIFSLEDPRSVNTGFLAQLYGLCRESVRSLGFEPVVEVTGEVNSIRGELATDLLATLREALSNAARHSGARSVRVELRVDPEKIELQVIDDGVGLPPRLDHSGRGIRNMAARAERHGGSCSVLPGPPSGAVVHWSVPRQ